MVTVRQSTQEAKGPANCSRKKRAPWQASEERPGLLGREPGRGRGAAGVAGPEGEVRTGREESKVARGADTPHAARVCGQLDGQSKERNQEDGNRNQERHRANDFLQVFFMGRQGHRGLTGRYKEATGLAGPVSSVHRSRGLTKWTLRAQGEVGRHCRLGLA